MNGQNRFGNYCLYNYCLYKELQPDSLFHHLISKRFFKTAWRFIFFYWTGWSTMMDAFLYSHFPTCNFAILLIAQGYSMHIFLQYICILYAYSSFIGRHILYNIFELWITWLNLQWSANFNGYINKEKLPGACALPSRRGSSSCFLRYMVHVNPKYSAKIQVDLLFSSLPLHLPSCLFLFVFSSPHWHWLLMYAQTHPCSFLGKISKILPPS